MKPKPPRIPGTRTIVKRKVVLEDGTTFFKSVWDRSGKIGEPPRLSDEEVRSWDKYKDLYDSMKAKYPNDSLYCFMYNPPGHRGIIRWYDYLVSVTGEEFSDIKKWH